MKSVFFWIVAVMMTVSVTGCDNPFEPLNTSNKIQGLTYFTFSATWERWDSDPEYDGLAVELSYFNEFGDSLSFHDKPHKVTIEIWTETDNGDDPPSPGSLLFSRTIEFSNSDDVIRLPIESYGGAIGLPSSDPITGIMLVRIFPPDEYPRRELFSLVAGQTLYEPEEVVLP